MLGKWMTARWSSATMVGSGIFLLPVDARAARRQRAHRLAGHGVGVMCIAFALARLQRGSAAGIQAYVEQAFGPTAAFLVTCGASGSPTGRRPRRRDRRGLGARRHRPCVAGRPASLPSRLRCAVVLTARQLRGVRAAGGLSIVTVADQAAAAHARGRSLVLQRGRSGGRSEPLARCRSAWPASPPRPR